MSTYRRSYYVAPEATKTFDIGGDELGPQEKRRVLLLEDDDELARTLKDLLQSTGYFVERVVNGAEGLKRILSDDYDAIVCDMIMPNFPGDMFYLAVQRAKPHLCQRFVFTTGHRADPRIDSFLKETKGLVLWKPFQAHELFDAVKVVISKAKTKGKKRAK